MTVGLVLTPSYLLTFVDRFQTQTEVKVYTVDPQQQLVHFWLNFKKKRKI